jgi:hypothetical protein
MKISCALLAKGSHTHERRAPSTELREHFLVISFVITVELDPAFKKKESVF